RGPGRLLEDVQHTCPERQRLAQVLEPVGAAGEGLIAEVAGGTPGGEHKVVVAEISGGGADDPLLEVDAGDRGEPEVAVGDAAEDGPHRVRDVGGVEERRRHLVEEGLEEVVVVAVDQGHVDVDVTKPLHGGQPAEAGAHHHHVGPPAAAPDAHALNYPSPASGRDPEGATSAGVRGAGFAGRARVDAHPWWPRLRRMPPWICSRAWTEPPPGYGPRPDG